MYEKCVILLLNIVNNTSLYFPISDNVDSLEKRIKLFFSNAKKMKATEKEAEYRQILKDYYKTLEDAGL